MPTIVRSNLHVEGPNDVHVVHHLLLRHGFDCPIRGDKRPQQEFADSVPEITPAGDKDSVLSTIETAIPVSNGRSVGFILDTDESPRNRWHAVRDRLRVFGLELPDEIPNEGFVADVEDFRARVGVWLMPDNQRAGALEHFLQDLVADSDPLLPLAESSTAQAKTSGAEFADIHHRKAVLHTWLAWQRQPGLPYGSAIQARFFTIDSPAALAFVDWYRRLFP